MAEQPVSITEHAAALKSMLYLKETDKEKTLKMKCKTLFQSEKSKNTRISTCNIFYLYTFIKYGKIRASLAWPALLHLPIPILTILFLYDMPP